MKCICGVEFEAYGLKKYCSGKCRVRETMRRYRSRLSNGLVKKPPVLAKVVKEAKELKVVFGGEYGCGCKREEGKVLCSKHGRV